MISATITTLVWFNAIGCGLLGGLFFALFIWVLIERTYRSCPIVTH